MESIEMHCTDRRPALWRPLCPQSLAPSLLPLLALLLCEKSSLKSEEIDPPAIRGALSSPSMPGLKQSPALPSAALRKEAEAGSALV